MLFFFNTAEEHLARSLRWPASAYAHYLREHAASWLPFTKAGTQGQREWERGTCVLTPSDETLPQPRVRAQGRLSVATGESVRAHLPTQISYIDCLI